MKRIVQRFALAFLLLLPMLANAQVTTTAAVNYGARGSVEVSGHDETAYDTVKVVVNSGYMIDNAASWFNGSTVITPGTTTGTLAVANPSANTYWLMLDKDQTWNILVKILPTHPAVHFVATNGSVQDGGVDILGDGTQTYAYGTHVYLTAVPATSYSFGGWLESAAVDANTISTNADTNFYIFDDVTLYPSFDPAKYKITISFYPRNAAPLAPAYYGNNEVWDNVEPEEIANYMGDDLLQDQELVLPYDKNVTIYPNPSGSIYESDFEWYINGSLVATTGYYTLPDRTADMTVEIHALPKSFSVTVDNDDDYFGSVSPAGINSWEYGSIQTITATVNDPSFKFVCWKENGTQISTEATYNYLVTGNKTVTAYWDYATFPVTLTANPADKGTFTVDGAAYDNAAEYSFGTNHTVVATPANGYHFVQWSDNGSTNPTRDITIATTNSYTAEFATENYAVSFATGYAGYLTLGGDGNYDFNTEATVTATAVDADKYIFKEWQVAGSQVSTNASYTFTVTGDVELTAVYEPVAYTITVTSVDDNEGTAVATATSVDYDDDFTVTATPNYGYVFKSWTTSGFGDVTTNPFTHAVDIANAAHEHTFMANFGPAAYDVTVNLDNATHATSVSGATTGIDYGATHSVSVDLDATKPYLEFKGWKNENDQIVSTETSFNFTVTGDTTFIATFDTIAYDVTATVAAGEGTVTASVNAKYGRTVTLTATPATGWHVQAWSNAATTDAINVTVAATAAENTYTVSFEHDPVTITVATDPVALAAQASPAFTPDPATFGDEIALSYTEVEGYTFANWTKGSSDAVADPAHVTVDGDATYTAHFTINTYTIDVTVNDNAMGVANIDGAATATAEYHSAIDTRVAATANPGYTFVKWQANGVDIADITTWEVPAMPTVDDHITLTAVFDYNVLDVTGHAVDSVVVAGGSGTDLSTNDAAFVTTGSKVIGGIVTTTAPAITGWHFVSWMNEPYAAKATVNPRKDTLTSADPLTLTAIYAIDSHAVVIVNNYGTAVSFTGAKNYAYGANATVGYTIANTDSLSFTEWGDGNNDSPTRSITVLGDVTLTPVFGVIEYTVNATTDGNGTITAPATLPVDVAYGQTVTITAQANHGYDFVNWTNNVNTDVLTDPTIAPKVTGDVTWTANFEKTDYTVTTVVKDVAGNEQPTMATVTGAGDYEFEASATLSYTANDGFTFVKWIGEGAGEESTLASITFGVNNDTTIIAQFDTLTTTVSADVDDAAHGSVAVSNGTPKYFTQVELTVTENPGYEFKYWADDNTITDNPRTIDVTFGTTHSYTAVFEPRQYTVTVVNTDGNGTVAITGTTENNVTVDFGETVQIVATANTGYSFDKWNGSVATATYDYVVAAKDTTFTATFVPNTNDLTITSSNFYRGGVRFGTTGDSLETDTKTDIAFNETTHIEALPAYGYAFESWSDDPTAPAKRDYVFTTDADVALTANFVYAPYTIKVNLNDAALATIELNGTEVASGDETSFGYTEHVNVTVTPVANYHIVNGTTPYTNANPLSFGVDVLENLEYNYTIVPDTFSVEFVAGVNGSITNFTNGEFAYGTTISGVTAVADPNYHFINWSTGATTEVHPDTIVRSNISITANFSIDAYDFTVVSEDESKGTVTGSQTGVNHGDNVTATATPLTGYVFGSWTDGNGTEVSTANPYEFALTAPTTLTAHFVNETHTLTVSTFTPERGWISIVDGNAVETKDETGATVSVSGLPTHTDITVTATANTGYHFDSWSDDPSITAAQRVISDLNQDSSFTANFAYDTYTVTWNPNVAARGDIEPLGTVAYHFGAVDTLKANPAAGYIFQKWEDGSTVNPRYYTVNGDADLTAIFIYDTIYTDTTKCDSFEWNGHTYTVTEVAAPATLTDAEGYDSIVVLTVNINYSNTEDTVATACDGFEWHGENRTATGDYEFVMAAANQYGCDSTITLHLTINQHQDSEETVAECESYDWTVNGQTYTESGDYTSPIIDANNCDATAILHLTINQPTAGTDVQEHCDSYTWIDAVTYTESTNTPSMVLPAANQYGCDSTVTLNLTINQTAGTKYVDANCDSYTWTINDNVYTASGVYTYGHLNGSGCYVVDTLDLTINHNSSTVFADQDACGEYLQTWTDGTSETIAVSGPYQHSYTSAEGCPSMDEITVNIRPAYANTDVHHDICDSYTWPLNGETYTESNNTASVTLTAVNGCDSVITLDLTINQHQDTEENIVSCDSYTWAVNGMTYTTSDTYTEEIFDANNCVATATLNLTISESNTGIDEQHACNTFTWIDGMTYTESNNTATMVLTNAAGCDSVVTLNLTVTYNQNVEISDSGCESYEWNGLTFTESRDVVYTSTDQFGCDSVTTLHLTINHPTTGEFTDSAYGLYIWNGETYQTDGDYEQTLTDGNGCDSVVTLHLTILLPDNPFIYDTACGSYTWALNGMTYTESGAYNDTIRSLVNGEDSIITTLYLLINEPVNPEPIDMAACGSYTWHGTVYDVDGTYTFDTIDAHNCAITETLNLTINTAVDPDAVEAVACDTYEWHGERTATGTYTFDTVDANGCAITETLNLTINNSQNVALPEVVACESYEWNGQTYTASGDLSYTTTDVNGCDSTTTLTLFVNYGTHNTENAVACGSYEWNGETYTTTGVYTYSYLNIDQCESVDTLNLTINEAQTVALPAVTACDSYEWNGETYTASQELSVTVPGMNGCDSTTTLALTINQHQDSQETVAACDTYTWTVDNNTYTTSGTYTAAITDANGCAATATLALTINQPQDSQETIAACDTYTWNGTTYTTSGTYTANITDANGCAATATLNLTVNQHQDSQVSASACDTYTWNGNTYTTSGVYTSPITDANGCAATATLTLTVNQSVTNAIALTDTGSVVFNGVTYTADTVVTMTYAAANGCDSTVTATITVIPEIVVPDSVMVNIIAAPPAHGTVTPSTTAYYAVGETVTATATADSGYQFTQWIITHLFDAGLSHDTVTSNPINYVITADDVNSVINIMAEFESLSGVEDSMTIVLATADATMGTTNPAPGTYRIADGDSIIISAVANPGYQHLYWIRETQFIPGGDIYVDTLMGNEHQIDAETWLITSTTTYTAYFEIDTNYMIDTIYHFVTLMTANVTMGTVSASDSVIDGAEFTATAFPNDGYHFVAWTNGGVLMSTDNPYTFTVNADITLTATFEADPVDTVYYNVAVNYDATMGTITGDGTYIEGTIVTLTATPNNGYHFVAWYDGDNQLLTTNLQYTFTVSSNMNFTAEFAADPVYYTVTASANDPYMGYVNGAGQYEEGATVSLTAQANEGYHFVSWSNGETTPTISFAITCDTSFVAYFEANDTPQAIDETDMNNVTIYSADSRIIILGAEGMDVNVYDINGRTINRQMNAGETVEFRMATTGVYLVKVGNAPAKRVLVVR